MKKALWTILFLLLWTTASTFAQECPDYVEEALINVADTCAGLARNELCYGNTQLTVESNADVIFENPGDVINVADIEALSLSGSDSGAWGVGLMNLQANLPNTVTGQFVTVLLFGNVEIEPADDSLQAFYFSGGIGQPTCGEAPNGIVFQSPAGYSASLNINGARVEFGSTILLQYNEDSMSLSTLAGVATLQTEEGRQIVPQGTQSSIALDDNEVEDAPSFPVPLAAESLLPYVSAINASGLMLPTYEDAAINPRVQALVEAGLMPVLDSENPLMALDETAIPAAVEALEVQTIQLSSGHWVMASQTHEVIGDCIDATTGGMGNGGGVGEGEIVTTPICSLQERGAIVFGSNPIEALGLNLYGMEYTDEQPNFGAGEGTVVVTNRWEYRVISPTQIEMTFTSAEEGGCTLVSVFVYELHEEDANACEDVNMSSNSDTEEIDYQSYEVVSGEYHSDDLYVTGCEGDFGSQFETIALTVQEDSLDVSAGDEVYNLPAMGTFYMFYENTLTISVMAFEEGSMSFTFADGACMVAGNYMPSE